MVESAANKRAAARKRLLKLLEYQKEQLAIRRRILRIVGQASPKGVASEIQFERVGGSGLIPTITQLKQITALQGRLWDIMELSVNEELVILHTISLIDKPNYRALLQDVYVNGLTLSEISEEWEKPFNTVKWQHKRALEAFYENML